MNQLTSNILALAVSLAFSAGALADEMTKVDYKAARHDLAGETFSCQNSRLW